MVSYFYYQFYYRCYVFLEGVQGVDFVVGWIDFKQVVVVFVYDFIGEVFVFVEVVIQGVYGVYQVV